MPRATTPSFVTEIEMLPTGKQAKKLRSKFEAARQVYNACLGESMRRLDLMRQSKAWQKARKISTEQEKRKAFRECQTEFGFSAYSVMAWANQFTKTWINEHIGQKTGEAITADAFKAAANYLFAGGKRRRPKFRPRGDLRSVAGRTRSCCKWDPEKKEIHWGDKLRRKYLTIRVKINEKDKVVEHGINSPVKYVRAVRRVIRGKERFFAQLVCEGEPYRKPSHKPKRGVVGVDIGTQTIAAVGEGEAFLDVLARGVERDDALITRLNKTLDASRRATNPEFYAADGQFIKRKPGERRQWKYSARYLRVKQRRANLLRKKADQRKNLHGQMVARILSLGDDVRTEKLNFQSWAKKAKRDGNKSRKRYGRSVSHRAPGLLVQLLKRQAEKWGAVVTEIETRTTRLSQTCQCGRVKKKSSRDNTEGRVHECPDCGIYEQRDLYSAYLARFVENDQLQGDLARSAWSSNCPALGAAWSEVLSGPGIPSSLGLRFRDRRPVLPQSGVQNISKSVDVVPAECVDGSPAAHSPRESHKEEMEKPLGTTFITSAGTTFSETKTTRTNGTIKGCDGSGADTG